MPVFAQLELSDHHVLHVQLQENGIQTPTNVFAHHQWPTGPVALVFAQLTLSDLNVFHAQPQEPGISAATNVFAHHQWLTGTELNVFVQLTLSDLNVFHAQPQELGTSALTNVSVQLQRPSGTEPNVFVQSTPSVQTVFHVLLNNIGINKPKLVFALNHSSGTVNTVFVNQDSLVQTVFHAHLNNIGINKLKLVFVHHHLSGTVNIVSAHQDGLWSTDNAADVQVDMNGKTTNVSTVTVNIFHQSGGQKLDQLQLDQAQLELDQQPPPQSATFVQLDQSGMMLQTNVSIAHYQTSPSKRTPQPENGNVSVTVHSNSLLTLMVPNHANDWIYKLIVFTIFSFNL